MSESLRKATQQRAEGGRTETSKAIKTRNKAITSKGQDVPNSRAKVPLTIKYKIRQNVNLISRRTKGKNSRTIITTL
jgi:hypothetical protein